MVNELYQDANNCECVNVQFKNSKIKLTTGTSAGWKCEISPDHHMVKLIIGYYDFWIVLHAL